MCRCFSRNKISPEDRWKCFSGKTPRKNNRKQHKDEKPFALLTDQILFVLRRMELPITITSEKAMARAPIMGLRKPAAAMGMATTL